ncbi:hypothetical protein [Oryzibacter oryziterrae]|uniref:hypothetical protein n=1 Tax=Oryzibacter oryziterrae TaxID=2766474 RepID=UPI001F469340|nr:hypothetical protein [Oryzibacter oryziterrae]
MSILVGTPNNRGLISTIHFQMVLNLLDHFRAKRPKMEILHRVSSCAIIGFGRNALASQVLDEPSISHLLLIDPDISIPAHFVTEMLDFDKPVVACPYPTRDWDRQAFVDAARKYNDAAVAEACAATYVGGDDALIMRHGPNGPMPISDGSFARVSTCGAGLVLIKRQVFEKIAATCPHLLIDNTSGDYSKLGFKGDRVLECFEHATDLPSHMVAEGAFFGKTWVDQCGGEIWTHMEATIMRQTEYRFVGHFASKLKLGMI